MSKKFPVDEFDSVPVHGGRHRRRRTNGDRFVEFLRVMVAGAVLTGAGYYGLNFVSNQSIFSGDTSNQQPDTGAIEYKGNGVGLAVVDGSGRKGQASLVGNQLLDASWNVFSAADLIDSLFQPITNVTKTQVVIQSEDLRSTANSIVSDLGANAEIVVSATYPDPITVVIGSDFK